MNDKLAAMYRDSQRDMRAEVERLTAENAELKSWIIEASSAFRDDGGQDTIEEAVGLVRLCHEAIAELRRLSHEVEYANAWRRLAVRLNLPYAITVDDVLAATGLTGASTWPGGWPGVIVNPGSPARPAGEPQTVRLNRRMRGSYVLSNLRNSKPRHRQIL